VYVDAAITTGATEHPPPPAPEGAVVVRALTTAARWGEVVRGLFPRRERPRVRMAWATATDEAREAARAFAKEARLEVLLPGEEPDAPVDALLWLAMDVGETLPAAPPTGAPLLSDDFDHWGAGAVVVLVPDHRLLGRIAADAGRRLLRRAEHEGPERRRLGATELRVDLSAADAAGLEPPLPFLAAADQIRRGPRPRTPAR
jgi:hypothetical protein